MWRPQGPRSSRPTSPSFGSTSDSGFTKPTRRSVSCVGFVRTVVNFTTRRHNARGTTRNSIRRNTRSRERHGSHGSTPGGSMDIRDSARMYLLQVPPFPSQITSNGPLAALFTKLSGITQSMLLNSWANDPPPGLTSCNGFVGIYGNSTGIAMPNRFLGQCNLDKKLAVWGKSFAWVTPSAGVRPKFGDVFELAPRLHQ